jgi:hypothetical protein
VASYATLADVKARAGVIGDAWGPATTPSDSEITSFLDNVADEVSALIESHGLTAPAAGTDSAKALVNLNANGALVLALEAAFPDQDGPSSPPAIYDRVSKRFEGEMKLLLSGKHPALTLLESGSAAPTASSFWSDEPEYGALSWPLSDWPGRAATTPDTNPALAPAFRRGQSG